MTADVRTFIVLFFALAAGVWVITKYQGSTQVINSLAQGYASAAQATLPQQGAG